MPEQTGFELLESLPVQPKIIFVTAFDEYALKAFEFGAVDYLLKPVEPSRLAATIHRILALGTRGSPKDVWAAGVQVECLDPDQKVLFRTAERFI